MPVVRRRCDRDPSRLPPSALGEMAALLTSACSSPLSRRVLISAIAASVLVEVGEIDLDPSDPRALPPTGSVFR